MMGELLVEPRTAVHFKGPFYDPSMSEVKLTNSYSSEQIAFKFLTTANTHFQVGPVYGLIKPGETLTVDILLQPLVDGYGRPIGGPFDRRKQKFMIKWRPIMRGEEIRTANDGSLEMKKMVNELFSKVSPRKVQLSCVFDENIPPQSVNNNNGETVQESGGFELPPSDADVGGSGTTKLSHKHSGAADANSLDDLLQPEVIATLGAFLLAIIIFYFIL